MACTAWSHLPFEFPHFGANPLVGDCPPQLVGPGDSTQLKFNGWKLGGNEVQNRGNSDLMFLFISVLQNSFHCIHLVLCVGHVSNLKEGGYSIVL